MTTEPMTLKYSDVMPDLQGYHGNASYIEAFPNTDETKIVISALESYKGVLSAKLSCIYSEETAKELEQIESLINKFKSYKEELKKDLNEDN